MKWNRNNCHKLLFLFGKKLHFNSLCYDAMVLLEMQVLQLEYEFCFINSQRHQGITNINLLIEILNLMEFLLFTSLGSEF